MRLQPPSTTWTSSWRRATNVPDRSRSRYSARRTPDELLALVTDVAVRYDVSQFRLDEATSLADRIETLQ